MFPCRRCNKGESHVRRPEPDSLWLPFHHTNDVTGCSPHGIFPVFCPADRLKTPGSALLRAASLSSYQRRGRLFTARNFPGVLPGGQAEDRPEDPKMSTGTMIFMQNALPGKRGQQSGKKYCSFLPSRQGNRRKTRVP